MMLQQLLLEPNHISANDVQTLNKELSTKTIDQLPIDKHQLKIIEDYLTNALFYNTVEPSLVKIWIFC